MSIQDTQRTIERIQNDITSLHRKLTDESRNEASKTERISQIKRSITSSTSQSSVQSKLRDVEYAERDIASIQKKKADLTKQVADKTAELHKYQQRLFRKQEEAQKKMLDSFAKSEKESKRKQEGLMRRVRDSARESMSSFITAAPSYEVELIPQVTYDAFISHASEDKEELVRPLAEKLRAEGFAIWYDEFELRVGDSLRRSIDRGLANSRFGILVLSPNFFAKNWTQYELDGLVTKEIAGGKVILPLWHKVSKDEVMSYSPSLADKVALNTAMFTIDELTKELGGVLK